jgi:tRNA G46 methylase TrmB
MSTSNSKEIQSNQQSNHSQLEKVVRRHLTNAFLKPYANHNRQAFEETADIIKHHTGPLIFDSFCGVGESSAYIAQQNPQAFIIGIDKSSHRINKHSVYLPASKANNYHLVRADVDDFWRLAVAANWRLEKHYLLYPNPWPKAAHLKRRCHGSPLFPSLLQLGGTLELRSNWLVYLQEFKQALDIAGKKSQLDIFTPVTAITPFERKYMLSQHKLWRCVCELDKQV